MISSTSAGDSPAIASSAKRSRGWVATANNGLYRIHGDNADHFGLGDGLSGNSVTNLYEDQEGIIWAATSNGIDNFWDPWVTTYSETEGLVYRIARGRRKGVAFRDGRVGR